MGRIIHFEIPSDSPEKLTSFYSEIFGWTYQKYGDMEYWLAGTGDKDKPGIDGAITRRSENVPYTVNTVEVNSIDQARQLIQQHGGQVLSDTMDIPDVGKFAYCKDPEGNIFGILQSTGNM